MRFASLLVILPLVEETGSGYMFGYAYPVMYDCSAIIITTGVRRNAVLTNSTNTTKVARYACILGFIITGTRVTHLGIVYSSI
ncbi:MAG TPA: hypothetical protein VE971_05345 [Candidatus Eisenbacteria bacterium]|nr:hypothetical protein [Candidatus Eisenbacteria bacterium]